MYSFCVLAVVLAVAVADSVPFKDCGSKTGAIKTVDVSGCKAFPCQLKHGTDVEVDVTFESHVATKTLTASVHGTIAGIPIPFPIPNADGCKSNCKCPVANGDKNVYKNKIAVSKMYPKVQVVVKWELKDDQGNDVFCFVIPAVIVD